MSMCSILCVSYDCSKNHSYLYNRDSPALTTRLIDVNGSEDTVRVC